MEWRWDETKSAAREGVSSGNHLEARPGRFPWLQTGPSWRSVSAVTAALLGVVWSVCRGEAPLRPPLGLTEAACRVLWFGGLAAGLAVLIGFLEDLCLGRSRRNATEIQPEVMAEQKYTHTSWEPSGGPGGEVPLSWALADGLVICLLQEPLSQPTLPHIEALRARLESVSQTLQGAEGLSGGGPHREDDDPVLLERVKTLRAYLQQRTRLLGGLVRAQGGFEADVAGLLGGLELSWTQLEELHTRVTLTKDWSRGHGGDLASTKAEAESVSSMVSRYRTRLQLCEDHRRDTTQLLQELTWSHTHLSARVSDGCSSESVWTELLLQSNIEQFDQVQESFLSLDQQTSTFQAHLYGLEGGALSASASSSSSSSEAAVIGRRHSEPAPAPNADSSLDKSDQALPSLDKVSPRTLCERSASQLSSALGRLRKSGKRS